MLGLPGLKGGLLREIVEFGRGGGPSVPLLEIGDQVALPPRDQPVPLRPPVEQSQVGAFELTNRPFRIAPRTVHEPHPELAGQVLLQCGVVELRHGDVGLEHDPAVDRQPGAVLGRLHLVRDRDVRVQVRIACSGVAMREGRRDDAVGLHLPDAVAAAPGVDRQLLHEAEAVRDGLVVAALDHVGDLRVGQRPQGRHRLHWGEGGVVAGNAAAHWPRGPDDETGQLAGVHRLAAEALVEVLASHLGPELCADLRRHRGAWVAAVREIPIADALGELDAEFGHSRIDAVPLAELHGVPDVTVGRAEIQRGEPLSGQGVVAEPEQREHLVGGHDVSGDHAINPHQARPDPVARALALLFVVVRQAGVPLLGRIHRRHLPGQVVVARAGGQLVQTQHGNSISFRPNPLSLGRGCIRTPEAGLLCTRVSLTVGSAAIGSAGKGAVIPSISQLAELDGPPAVTFRLFWRTREQPERRTRRAGTPHCHRRRSRRLRGVVWRNVLT